jgi:hypothetical protein
MTFFAANMGLFTALVFCVAGPAGIAYFLWRLSQQAPPPWKIALRTISVILMCVAVVLLLLIVATYAMHPT